MVGESSISHRDYRSFVREAYIRNIRMFSSNDLPCTVEMLSDDFFDAWRKKEESTDVLGRSIKLGGPISFCFIDGNHTYEYVKRDFTNCHEFLERGGFCFLDDSEDSSGFPGVRRIVTEIKGSGEYEVVTKNPHYLFRKR